MAATPLIVFGITGRMGQSLVRALGDDAASFQLRGAIASATSGRIGQDAALDGRPTGIKITAEAATVLVPGAVALDFSIGPAVAGHARACAAAGVPLLVGATGFDAATRDELARAAQRIALLVAPNTSIGVAVLSGLVAEAATALGPTYDVAISEAHHRAKVDAPSGTALALRETVAGALGSRVPGAIGFSVIRAGDIVGEHTVTFAGPGERLELTHRATDRMTFAHGALRAAAWLNGRPAGLYGMKDVLLV